MRKYRFSGELIAGVHTRMIRVQDVVKMRVRGRKEAICVENVL
jgi:hypothetical protein